MPTVAITRPVSPAIARCELTHLTREPIDLERARAQHEAYEEALRRLGCRVERLAEEPDLADSVFVEDAAVVLDELAVITRPGAVSRRGETESVARALASYRPLVCLEAPATLDGGDVLRVGPRLFVGRTARTNVEGIEQLERAVVPFGYAVVPVEVSGCLHLKTAVTALTGDLLLLNPDWLDPKVFGLPWIPVAPQEPHAANALAVKGRVIYPGAHLHTRERLLARGLSLSLVDVSELARAEAGVTCCSLLVEGAV